MESRFETLAVVPCLEAIHLLMMVKHTEAMVLGSQTACDRPWDHKAHFWHMPIRIQS